MKRFTNTIIKSLSPKTRLSRRHGGRLPTASLRNAELPSAAVIVTALFHSTIDSSKSGVFSWSWVFLHHPGISWSNPSPCVGWNWYSCLELSFKNHNEVAQLVLFIFLFGLAF